MRILFCTNSVGAKGGIEVVTITKANALANIEGNTVAICYTDKGTYPESTPAQIDPKVKVYDLGVTMWDLVGMRALLTRSFGKFLAMRRSLTKLIREFKPDIVISTGSYEKFAVAAVSPKSTGVNFAKIREYHFNSTYRKYIGNYNWLFRTAEYFDNHILGRFFDKNYLLTQQDLQENFSGNKRFDYQHNPCRFVIDRSESERENVVLAVGRLMPQKNFASLLRIWHLCHKNIPGWRLMIVGNGLEAHMLKDMVKELGISDSVTFKDFDPQVAKLMLHSKVMAVTSKYEGFSLVIVEAMSNGCVPISYRCCCGPQDIITDGVNGVLVDIDDERQFADKLTALCNDEDALRRYSAAGYDRAADFDINKIAADWMANYSALLSAKFNC